MHWEHIGNTIRTHRQNIDLFLSKCLRTDTAFLIRQYRSSGTAGEAPAERERESDNEGTCLYNLPSSTSSPTTTHARFIHLTTTIHPRHSWCACATLWTNSTEEQAQNSCAAHNMRRGSPILVTRCLSSSVGRTPWYGCVCASCLVFTPPLPAPRHRLHAPQPHPSSSLTPSPALSLLLRREPRLHSIAIEAVRKAVRCSSFERI